MALLLHPVRGWPRAYCPSVRPMKKSAPDEEVRWPVNLDSTSNGEYIDRDPSMQRCFTCSAARWMQSRDAGRKGMCRREWLATTGSAAIVRQTLNLLGRSGGRYPISRTTPQADCGADSWAKCFRTRC